MFDDPMSGGRLQWANGATFNPAATVKDGKMVILYRAEDLTGLDHIGGHTSRIGYATTTDGVNLEKRPTPVLFPGKDNRNPFDWPGGCEDPRVTKTEDGLYVMMYTEWNRQVPRLCVATSTDLIHWRKHGEAFKKAYE